VVRCRSDARARSSRGERLDRRMGPEKQGRCHRSIPNWRPGAAARPRAATRNTDGTIWYDRDPRLLGSRTGCERVSASRSRPTVLRGLAKPARHANTPPAAANRPSCQTSTRAARAPHARVRPDRDMVSGRSVRHRTAQDLFHRGHALGDLVRPLWRSVSCRWRSRFASNRGRLRRRGSARAPLR